MDLIRSTGPVTVTVTFSDISFGTSTSMCLDLVSWVQEVHNAAIEVKTPLDIYLQRHSPLSPDLWLHYSRLSARYISRHVPGADISLYPVSSYLSKWIKPGAK